jgi:hypothetical protein
MMGMNGNFGGAQMNPYMLNPYFQQPYQFGTGQNLVPFIGNMQ